MKISVLVLLFLTAVTLASSTDDQEEDALPNFEEGDDGEDNEDTGVLGRRKRDLFTPDRGCKFPSGFYEKPHNPSHKQGFLDAHETLRRQAGVCGELRPEWDNKLADMAQATADKCDFTHNNNLLENGDELGQSFYVKSGRKSKEPIFAVQKWYDESKRGSIKGHFRQLVSDKVKKIGCAIAECTHICKDGVFKKPPHRKKIFRWQFFVCNYDHRLIKGESHHCSCYNRGSNDFYKMVKGECEKCSVNAKPPCKRCTDDGKNCRMSDENEDGPVQVRKVACKDQAPWWCSREKRRRSCKQVVMKNVCRKTCGSC